MLKEQLKFKEKVEVPNSIENVVIAGMGGSGIAGKIFGSTPKNLYTLWMITSCLNLYQNQHL